jgi:hypothetical protein
MEDHDHTIHSENLGREYLKFALILLFIATTSVLLTMVRGWTTRQFANDFMAIFFVTFASFKFIHLELFALTYRTYDVVAKKFPAWGYLFPFVEMFLGFAYLLSNKNNRLNLLTLVITGVAGYGVWKTVYAKNRPRSRFHCACLGTVIKLPLSTVSFTEDVLMFVMAAAMLLI